MRFSYRWLREFLPTDLSPEGLAKRLLLLGFEVSSIETLGPSFEGIVIGQILDVQKHPNADRLSLCSVSDGKETLSIVCGAKNVSPGIRVPVARVGAKLPGGRAIERAKIRGTESQGMICSAAELGLPESKENGIMILPSDAPIGADATTLLGEKDWAMEIEITPNRPDCLSHLGLARELSIHFGIALKASPLTPTLSPEGRGSVKNLSSEEGNTAATPSPSQGEGRVRVVIEAKDACRRYLGREFHDLRVGPSPAWMAKRLEAVGVRSINNLVDITNYVLFEIGHPLHAFDLAKLQGGSIITRYAKPGEKLRALDGKEYALSSEDLVIADASVPVALAGVIGGEPTSVTEKTTACFLEAAHFQPGKVRKTSRRLGIRTDSSYIFERGTSPESAAAASGRAAELILQLCAGGGASGGSPSISNPIDAYPNPLESAPIEISTERINEILGAAFPADRVESILKGMAAQLVPQHNAPSPQPSPTRGGGNTVAPSPSSPPPIGRRGQDEGRRDQLFMFYPPSFRLDLSAQSDLAEEVARHAGYDAVPSQAAPVTPASPASLPQVESSRFLRDRLTAFGFSEAYNYDFVSGAQLKKSGWRIDDPRIVSVLNPLSEDQAYLRPTMFIGLLQSASYNLSRGLRNFGLFEVGCTYEKNGNEIREHPACAGIIAGNFQSELHWDSAHAPRPVDYYRVKGVVDSLMESRHPDLQFKEIQDSIINNSFFLSKATMRRELPNGRLLAEFGLLHPVMHQNWDISEPAAIFFIDLETLAGIPVSTKRFKSISPFPAVTRDLSIVLNDSIPYSEVEGCIKGLGSLTQLELIDRYIGKGIPKEKKSLTLRFTFVRQDRTLRDEEVEQAMQEARKRLEKECGAKLRG